MKKLTIKSLIILVSILIFALFLTACNSEFTITFDSCGGTKIQSIKMQSGQKVNKPDDPTRDGYTFDGWYISNSEFTEENKWSFIGYSITSNTILYAKWNIAVYSIYYTNLQGGINPNLDSFYTIESETINFQNPTRFGYAGIWNITTIPKGSTGNVIVTAQWQTEQTQLIAPFGLSFSYSKIHPQVLGYNFYISWNYFYNDYSSGYSVSNYLSFIDYFIVELDGQQIGQVSATSSTYYSYQISSTSGNSGGIFAWAGLYNYRIKAIPKQGIELELIESDWSDTYTFIGGGSNLGSNSTAYVTLNYMTEYSYKPVSAIHYAVFNHNKNIENIQIPTFGQSGGNPYLVRGILNSAFKGNINIKSIEMPETISYIESEAFAACTGIENITIPRISSMGADVFSGWTSKQTIYIKGYSSMPYNWDSNWNRNCSANIVFLG